MTWPGADAQQTLSIWQLQTKIETPYFQVHLWLNECLVSWSGISGIRGGHPLMPLNSPLSRRVFFPFPFFFLLNCSSIFQAYDKLPLYTNFKIQRRRKIDGDLDVSPNVDVKPAVKGLCKISNITYVKTDAIQASGCCSRLMDIKLISWMKRNVSRHSSDKLKRIGTIDYGCEHWRRQNWRRWWRHLSYYIVLYFLFRKTWIITP